jgi:hypothetical protein
MSLEQLEQMSPSSGEKIQEDGTIINVADALYVEDGEVTVRV